MSNHAPLPVKSIFRSLFGKGTPQEQDSDDESSSNSGPDPSNEPVITTKTHSESFTVYETTVTHANGDTEVFESYGSSLNTESAIVTVETGIEIQWWDGLTHQPYIGTEGRSYSLHVLKREPALTEVATETWEITYDMRGDRAVEDTVDLRRVEREELGGGDDE